MIELPSDALAQVKAQARYLPLKESEHLNTHASTGEVLIFCVVGKLDAKVHDHHHVLEPNQLLHVPAGCPFRVEAQMDSVVLVTSLTAKTSSHSGRKINISATAHRDDEVQEALEETFPASDPPSYNSTIS
ncbi:hypothetical protein C5Y96_17545 [Blastopirellula marina]|uniref:Cupin 2 conserved barrel domain-containing protein n=1 Tax=Blastopirellula marina TaxID=124 RepID=A0A2S8F5C4_9BACT|nr:hypothetical protein C5Y96_17545 [Blastopirellula marina]RCS47885.1 hypothetical protein DTL36_17570 [Bremerella cremea]